MKLDRLRLKGITCFHEPIDLDFSKIPAGLIAIVGENGSGKTTLMEAFAGAVYGELPTRGPVAKYSSEKDSYLDITATFDAIGTYRARRNIDGVKGVQDAVLERMDTGARLNDGKVTTFKAAVEKVFPSLDTLLASCLAVQSRKGSFATREKGERKELFYALLGLNKYEEYAATARAGAAVLEKRIAELTGRREALLESTGDGLHEQLQAQAYALTEDLARAEDAKNRLASDLAVIDEALVALRADVTAKGEALTERARYETELAAAKQRASFFDVQDAELQADIDDQEKGIKGRLAGALARIQRETEALVTDEQIDGDLAAALEHIESERDQVVSELRQRIAKNKDLIDKGDDIRAAVADTAADTEAIGKHRASIDGLRLARIGAGKDVEAAGAKVTEIRALIDERQRAQRSGALLKDVPCGGIAPFDACQFLRDAATAAARAIELVGQDLDAALESAEFTLGLAQRGVVDIDAKVAQFEVDIAVTERRIQTLRPLVEMAAHLAVAQERIADREKAITAADERATVESATLRQRAGEAKAKRDSDRQDLGTRALDARAEAERELKALEVRFSQTRDKRAIERLQNGADIERLEGLMASTADAAASHTAAVAAAAAKELERTTVARELAEADKAFALVTENVAHLRRRQGEFATAHAQRVAIDAGITALQTHLVEWQVLAQMFGKEGLATLEIDSAGPGVSDGANDLLQASFGGRFAVELITQEPKADGKGFKEVFALQVYDHERGGDARDLADLSGGEQVIVDSALRLAIALWVNHRNEQPIRTVWLDETTGALDPENAQRYLAMLRRLHERAGLHHLIFVSHNPSVSSQADVQIQVGDGKAVFVYPPFAQTPASQEAA
jgi:exonuclease SbcC